MRIQVEFDDTEVRRMLQRLIDSGNNPRPALLEIGEELVDSTKARFNPGIGPDGTPWARNSPETILRKGRDKPLVDLGTLMEQIHYQLSGDDAVEIGSSMEYAAMQHFGGTKAEFPHLWGDIPGRPFIGISDTDEVKIIDIFNQYLQDQID